MVSDSTTHEMIEIFILFGEIRKIMVEAAPPSYLPYYKVIGFTISIHRGTKVPTDMLSYAVQILMSTLKEILILSLYKYDF